MGQKDGRKFRGHIRELDRVVDLECFNFCFSASHFSASRFSAPRFSAPRFSAESDA